MQLWLLAWIPLTSFIVALSGALMPGPLLTVTVGEAARRGFWAGPLIIVGHALLENFITKDGYVVTDRMARYRIPSIMHTPEITSIIVEDPAKDGPFGAKGVGESATFAVSPAVANAIDDACGARVTHLPLTPEAVLRAIRLKEGRPIGDDA